MSDQLSTPGSESINVAALLRGQGLTLYRARHASSCGPWFTTPGAAIDAARGGHFESKSVRLGQIVLIENRGGPLAVFINPSATVREEVACHA